MADRRDKAMDFIYALASRKPRLYLIGQRRVNQRRVARAMGVSPAALSRLISGETQTVTIEMYEGLKRWAALDSDEELFEAIELAPHRPPGAFVRN